MAKRLTIGSRAVAVAIMSEALSEASELGDDQLSAEACHRLADRLVTNAFAVEYKPNAEKLVLIISAGIEAPDSSPPD